MSLFLVNPADVSRGDTPYPPLYKPFKAVSGQLVGYLEKTPISSNAITIAWVLMLVISACALGRDDRFIAFMLVLGAILLDCLDGDLARYRGRGSESGTLLEQIGHWLGNMSIAAGAGTGAYLLHPGRFSVILSAAFCISQAVYIAVVRQVRPSTVGGPEVRRYQRIFVNVIKANYLFMPLELPLVTVFLIFGLHPVTIAVALSLLLISSVLIFLPHFLIILSLDRRGFETQFSEDFPAVSVRAAEELLSSRFESVTWYAPGASRLPPQVLRIGAVQPMYHRSEEFNRIWRELHEDLPKIFRTDGLVITLSCSGAGAMEAAVANLVHPGDRILVLNGGPSGDTWENIARSYGAEVIKLDVPYDVPLQMATLENIIATESSLKAVFATLSELAYGSKQDIAEIGKRVRDSGAFFVVDVIAGLAADDFCMDDWGVNVAVGASHEGLMAPPGIGLVALSRQMVNMIRNGAVMASPPPFYWDLTAHLNCIECPRFMVSTQTVAALYLSTRMILSGGLDRVLKHRHEVASGFRRGCTEVLNLSLVATHPTAACTTVKLPAGISAKAIQSHLLQRYAIGIARGELPSGEETLRIGHSGWLFRDDIYNAVERLALCLNSFNGEDAGSI